MTVAVRQTRRGRTRAAGCEAVGARPGTGRGGAGPSADEQRTPTLFGELGGEPTLDELVSGVWEGLAAHERVRCPVCEGELIADYGAHARPVRGRCGDCGTTLS